MSATRQILEALKLVPGGCEALSDDSALSRISRPIQSNPLKPPQQAALARAIETEVIPRLLMAHRLSTTGKFGRARRGFSLTTDDIDEFARVTVHHDITVAEAYVDALTDQGLSIGHVFAKLFAPTARRLGVLWEQDYYSFSEVTIGLSRIQQLVHELSPLFENEGKRQLATCSALLVPMPGEHHSLGLTLVESYFRQAGWNVWAPNTLSEDQIVSAVSHEPFDTVGISVTCHADVERISKLIAAIRKTSVNRHVAMMVGGRLINEKPALVAAVGADATDVDGTGAVACYEQLRQRWRGH